MRRRTAARVAVAVVAAVASACVVPSVARAKTLAELDSEISAAEASAEAARVEASEARERLAATVSDYYKAGGGETLLEILVGSEDIGSALERAQWALALQRRYEADKASAVAAAAAYDEAAVGLRALRDEEEAREEALARRSSIHFWQADGEWSSLRYWGGTVATHGCGLCSYAVMLDMLTGAGLTPADLLSLRGDWRGMEEYPDDSTGSGGLTHAEWTDERFDVSVEDVGGGLTTGDLAGMLGDDSVAIVCSRGRVFHDSDGRWRWSDGHYVVVYACDDDGTFRVQDSSYEGELGTAVAYTEAEMSAMLLGSSHTLLCSN